MELRIVFILAFCMSALAAPVPDAAFLQDVSEKFPAQGDLAGATLKKVQINKDGIVYVLTDRGMARLFGGQLALDRSFRPFNGRRLLDSAVAQGEVFYLFEDSLLCNGFAGTFAIKLPLNRYERVAVGEDLSAVLSGPTNSAVAISGVLKEFPVTGIPIATGTNLWLLNEGGLHRYNGETFASWLEGTKFQAIAAISNNVTIGTSEGLFTIAAPGDARRPRTELPSPNITALAYVATNLWAGSPDGAFRIRENGIDYYASRRWLLDDSVIDLAADAAGNIYVLTATGLNKIAFVPMTLAQKVEWYQRKIRNRHIRYGLVSELRLTRPGEPASQEMIDTDNDGTWNNYYMASQALRFGATGEEEAHAHAWETFAALERLESINPIGGFPSRTFERQGFRNSDPERWHVVGDGLWEWKAHTSSDEITAHAFGSAVLYECAARTPAERARIAAFIGKITDHIIKNNLYLIDVDGQPTLWARWNPEYVNWFPHTIGDRKLNSAEIVALLQFAYAITGKQAYKEKAYELIEKHGYLENIMSSMSRVAFTKGYIHKGIELGTDWNHSDDLLSFITYWTLHRFAFTDELKAKYAQVIHDHWEHEKIERNPLWNFIHARAGAKEYDVDGALWTLRRFPLDMVDWSVRNSHRGDITKLAENFRQQQVKELLPPGERRMTRWNSQPFILDGGHGGQTELAGDEFLLPYWMARYLKIVAP